MKPAQKRHNNLNFPTLQSKRFSYIQKSLKLLDEGSFKDQKLHIDGGIGDYRMRLFRLKDKNQYRKANHSVFTSSFTNKLIKSKQDNDNNELKSTIEKIISRPPHRESGIASSLSHRDQQRLIIKKGSFVNTIQEGQHLIYPYISQYQRKRWFDTVNNSKEKPFLEKFEKSQVIRASRKVSLKRNKNKYMFAYMDLHQNKQKQTIKN